MQPAFHRQRLAALVGTMTDTGAKMVARWEALAKGGEVVNVAQEMMRVTLNIAARTLFSVDVSHEADAVGEALTVALHEANRRIFTLYDLPLWVPTPKNVALREAREALDRVVYDIIATRRRTKVETTDLLGMLIEAKDEDTGETMTDEQYPRRDDDPLSRRPRDHREPPLVDALPALQGARGTKEARERSGRGPRRPQRPASTISRTSSTRAW